MTDVTHREHVERLERERDRLRAALTLLWDEAHDPSRIVHVHEAGGIVDRRLVLSEPCKSAVREALR